jgi:hypothetical protein
MKKTVKNGHHLSGLQSWTVLISKYAKITYWVMGMRLLLNFYIEFILYNIDKVLV